jgi:hypothetical protein
LLKFLNPNKTPDPAWWHSLLALQNLR